MSTTTKSPDVLAPPSRELFLLEMRAGAELGAFFATAGLLRMAPKGDGHPVLVLPGLAASDVSTKLLRTYLRDRGYRAHGWKMGANHGPRPGVEERMQQRLADLYQRYGRKVSVIGWSLGGVYARELARNAPDQVRSVITLGSPFSGRPRGSNAWKLFEYVSETKVEHWHVLRNIRTPPPVPSTAIFTRTDGIVAWRGCMEHQTELTENIEVEGSHCGLGHNPLVLYAVADRLAQAEDSWKPFQRTGLRSLVYRDPYRAPYDANQTRDE